MGSSVFEFIESFETEVLESYLLKSKCWYCYLDGTFVVWPHGRDLLADFPHHVNSHHPFLKFTMEIESFGKLFFLDVLVKRLLTGDWFIRCIESLLIQIGITLPCSINIVGTLHQLSVLLSNKQFLAPISRFSIVELTHVTTALINNTCKPRQSSHHQSGFKPEIKIFPWIAAAEALRSKDRVFFRMYFVVA